MNVPAKLGAYGAGLALVFAAALGAGAAVGPFGATDTAHHGSEHAPSDDDGDAQRGDDVQPTDHSALAAGGLEVSSNGYTLVPAATTHPASDSVPFEFRIEGPDGSPVTEFEIEHGKELHLIVVGRDLSGYQHVHPVRDEAGTWTVELDLSAAGTYRALADFTPEGADALTLGVDLLVPGDAQPVPVPAAGRTAEVDGYRVTLDGDLRAGDESPLTLTVSRDGQQITDLQPHLAAYGHLVALRAGDLAYLHVHPDDTPGDGQTPSGPAIDFVAHVPSAGTYRLYLDFRHDDVVRTAELTVEVGPADSTADSDAPHEGGHG